MATPYDIPPSVFIEKLKDELKNIKDITPPEWAKFVKTGAHRERSPDQPDWWYYRAASILYQIYKRRITGVGELRYHYGGCKDRGHRPKIKTPAGAKIIRTIMQQLEKSGLVEKVYQSHPKLQQICIGRRLTRAGRSLLDRIATRIARESGILK
ncbi:MAG: 30S ribosomal protein S19e [Candidatus Korarchaeota archaeon]|nr:30S ribosomal protein S19e [Thermoproteota archaeon]MCR8463559.1 30S ribosomal protein S19e [Thermoproteota archaeon]MCR8470828.1 30S ribosomal protein S19e [Thermoproteota archaeon]MCR8472534.1 30S ribosomal protein S19e [Thermoproteota archaeon]MCR8473726.1 30S ribosomal protein S19e [Thermoproteota archaeon]